MAAINFQRAYLNFKDKLRKGFLGYTRHAYQTLPTIERPIIFDAGCGTGVPTVELTQLSDGHIIAMDVDESALHELKCKIAYNKLAERIDIIICSLFKMCFHDESFDIIWAEGSINLIGFERGLFEWRRYLKPGGFLIVHDEPENLSHKIKQISACKYNLLDHFILSEDIWQQNYFAPLEKYISTKYQGQSDGTESSELIEQDRQFITEFKQYPARFRSAFFIMRRS